MQRLVYFLFLIIEVFSTPELKWHESVDGSKFYIETEKKFNWFQAWSECARKNMSLIAIDTLAKHKQIDGLLRKLFTPSPSVWISGNCNSDHTHFEWASTGERFTFTNWGPGQPTDSSNHEYCLVVWTDYQWHDGECNGHKNGFICEENQLAKESCKNVAGFDSNHMAKYHNVIFYFGK